MSHRKRSWSAPARPKNKLNTNLTNKETIVDCEDDEKIEEFFNCVYGRMDSSLDSNKDLDIEMNTIYRVLKDKERTEKILNTTGQKLIDCIKRFKGQTKLEDLVALYKSDGAPTTIQYTDAFDMTILHYAAWYCTPKIISYLIETLSADCTVEEENGLLAIHYAIASDNIKSVAVFTENIVTLDIAARGNMTPLHIAAIAGSDNVAEELLANGFEVDARSVHGYTPLALACRWSKVGVASILLDHGADCTIAANDGTTPILFSTIYCRSALPKMLDRLYYIDRDTMREDMYIGDLSMKFNPEENKYWHFSQLKWLALDKNMDIIMHPVVCRLVELKYRKFATTWIVWNYGLNILYTIFITATFILFGSTNQASLADISLCDNTDVTDYAGVLCSCCAGGFATLLFLTYTYTIIKVKAAIRKESGRMSAVMRTSALHYKFCTHKKVPELTIVPKIKSLGRTAVAMKGYMLIMIQSMIGSVMAISVLILGLVFVLENSDCHLHNATDYNTTDYNATNYNDTKYNATNYKATNYSDTKYNDTNYKPTDYNKTNIGNNSFNSTNEVEHSEDDHSEINDFFTTYFVRFCAVAVLHAWANLIANLRYTFTPMSQLIITLTYAMIDVAQFAVIFILVYTPFCIIAKVQYYQTGDISDLMMDLWRLSVVDGDIYDNGIQGTTLEKADMIYGKTFWQFLVGIYMFLVAVILINILIAMLSTTFQRVQDDSKAMGMLDKISYVGMIELIRSDKEKKSDDRDIVKRYNPDVGWLDEMSERFRSTMDALDSIRTEEILKQNSILKDRVQKLEKRNERLKKANRKSNMNTMNK